MELRSQENVVLGIIGHWGSLKEMPLVNNHWSLEKLERNVIGHQELSWLRSQLIV
jgi:hypothetical protein